MAKSTTTLGSILVRVCVVVCVRFNSFQRRTGYYETYCRSLQELGIEKSMRLVTVWKIIRSTTLLVINKCRSSEFVITVMITDRIGLHSVLLSMNHKNYNFREAKL